MKTNNHTPFPREITSAAELDTVIKQGTLAIPGCYPIYFIAANGQPLSFTAVKNNKTLCLDAWHRYNASPARNSEIDQWRIIASQINWEDNNLLCAHTGEHIPSAYGT
jgi:hypothetical protein